MARTTAQLTRAEAIAARDELHALKGTGGVWAVLNRTATRQAGYPVYHLLHVQGTHVVCDCPASQYGRVCAHRAAVRKAIVAERQGEPRYEAGYVPAMAPGLDRDSVEYDEDPSATAAAWC